MSSFQDAQVNMSASFKVKIGWLKGWDHLVISQTAFHARKRLIPKPGSIYSDSIKATFGGGDDNYRLDICLPFCIEAGETFDTRTSENYFLPVEIALRRTVPKYEGYIHLTPANPSIPPQYKDHSYVIVSGTSENRGWIVVTADTIVISGSKQIYSGKFSAEWGKGKNKVKLENGIYQFVADLNDNNVEIIQW